MVIGSELLTVIAATDQSSPTAPVTVIDSPVSGSVTVALALTTGILWSAAPPAVIVPAPAPLASRWSQRSPGHDHWSRGAGQVLGQITAVVLLVVVSSELLTVVAPAHQVTLGGTRGYTEVRGRRTSLTWQPRCPSLTPPSSGPSQSPSPRPQGRSGVQHLLPSKFRPLHL